MVYAERTVVGWDYATRSMQGALEYTEWCPATWETDGKGNHQFAIGEVETHGQMPMELPPLGLPCFEVDAEGGFVASPWVQRYQDVARQQAAETLWWAAVASWIEEPPGPCDVQTRETEGPSEWADRGVGWETVHELIAQDHNRVILDVHIGPDEEAMSSWMQENAETADTIPAIPTVSIRVISDPRTMIPYSVQQFEERTQFERTLEGLQAIPMAMETCYRFAVLGPAAAGRDELLGAKPWLDHLGKHQLWFRAAGDPPEQWRRMLYSDGRQLVDAAGQTLPAAHMMRWFYLDERGLPLRWSNESVLNTPPAMRSEDPPSEDDDGEEFELPLEDLDDDLALLELQPSLAQPAHPHQFALRVTNRSNQAFRVLRFGGFETDGDSLYLANYNGRFFGPQEWQGWRGAEAGGWLKPGESAMDPDCFGSGDHWWCFEVELEDGTRHWVGLEVQRPCVRFLEP